MKKIVVTLLLFISFIGYSQTNGITYQAVILNPSGDQLPGVNNTNAPLANKYICLKFSIIDQNSQFEYIETVQTTTDEFGMVNLVIGTGDQIGGYASSFSTILWNANPKSLKVDLSTTGICSYYTEISNQPFTAVPFALFAVNSESTAAISALQATVAANATATTAALATKEDAINKSTATTLGTSNVLFPTQNAVKTYVDTNITTVNATNTALQATVAANEIAATNAIAAVQADVNQNELDSDAADVVLQNNITTLQNTVTSNAIANTTALGLKEDAANKSNITTLGNSNVLFPTQNAVKTYVDNQIASATIPDADASTKGKLQLAGDLGGTAAAPTVPGLANKENSANKSTVTTLGNSDELFPTQNAVKTYVDSNITTVNATVAANATATTNAIAAVQVDVNQNELDSDAADVILQNNITTLQNTVTSNATSTTNALALKEDATNKSTISTLGNSDVLFPTQNAVKTYVDSQIASATIPDADASTKGKLQLAGDLGGTAAAPTVPGLASKAPIASPTFTGTVTAPIYASTPQALTDAATIDWNPTNGLNASVTLGGNRILSFASMPAIGSYGTLVVTQDATGGRTITLPSTSNKVLGSTSTTTIALSSAANAKDILNFYYDGTNCYWNIGQGYGTAATTNVGSSVSGVLPVANGGTGSATLTGYVKGDGTSAMTASSSIPLADVMGAAPIASPTFTGTVTAPIYASTPQALTDAATIDWNPTNGLNASVTLGGNRTLSFTATPTVGSYGTLVITQDATGGRTITLPSTSNKVLGSTSTTTVSLSSAAGAKDILNFYYDGTNCYWNVGQGYGTAATTNVGSSVSGVLPVTNGGTGSATLTGYVKGNGTSTMTANASIPVADVTGAAPIASPTFTGSVTAPIYASNPQTLTDAATIDWNPTNGLNASVTLGGNRTLSFTATPTVGSYGTLVITQDATGGRTITLPSTSNKVLGSTSTTTVSLSSAAGAKDILNFYYDGTNCYWNVGQGYGTAATVVSTNLATSVSGTLAVANGGTGSTTQNFVDLTTNQSIAGNKNFNNTIGIGTTSNYGSSKLHVAGNGLVVWGGTGTLLDASGNNHGHNENVALTVDGKANNDILQLRNTAPNTLLVVDKDGNMGIGNTTPSQKLEVTGNIKTSGTVTAGSVTYPNTHGTANQVLSTTGSGTLAWITPVSSAAALTGTLAVANGGTGATTLTGYLKGNGSSAMTASSTIPVSDVSGAAPLASPALTGTPTAPTAAANTNTTQVATTAFVTTALSSAGLPSQSGNNGKFLTTNGSTASWASSAGVPYSGASGAVNLGNYNLTVYGIKIGTSGTDNSALQSNLVIGRDALVNTTNGYGNMAIGNTALYTNVGGYNNVAIGNESQYKNLWGWGNVSFGTATLNQNVIGNFNTAVGHQAGYFLTSSYNTAFGHNALDGQADGGGNTGVGVNAGGVPWNQRTYNSTFLGYNAKAQSGLDNVIVIGYNAYTNEHHTIQLGDNRIVKLKTSGTIWSNGSQLTSDARLKTNIEPLPNSIDLIMKLNPVHYTKKNSIESTDYAKTENGFIAQELQKVLPYLVIEGTDKDKILSVDYNSIIPVLTKGIQEQQLLIKAQQKQIDEMRLMLDKLIKDKK
jgi:hypothetical protein